MQFSKKFLFTKPLLIIKYKSIDDMSWKMICCTLFETVKKLYYFPLICSHIHCIYRYKFKCNYIRIHTYITHNCNCTTYKLLVMKLCNCVAAVFLITLEPRVGPPRGLTMGLPAPYFINIFLLCPKTRCWINDYNKRISKAFIVHTID